MKLSSFKYLTLSILFLLISSISTANADVINIFCEFNSEDNIRGRQFSMVGVLTQGDFGDEIRGKFTFGLISNGEMIDTKLSTYKTKGTIEHSDFRDLTTSDKIRIKFINESSEFQYIDIYLRDQRRQKSLLKLKHSRTFKSNCHAKYED
jgi:hypothetical protein